MSNAIGNALIFIGAVVFLLSAISIIYPIKALGFSSRKRAFWVLIASVATAIAGGGLVAPQKPVATAQAPAPAPAPSATAEAPAPAPAPAATVEVPAPAPETKTEQAAAPEPAPSPEPPPTPAASAMPDDQRLVIAAVVAAQQAAEAASNDMQKGAALALRNKAICAALKGLKVKNWTGTVYSVGANGDGKGVLEIEIGPDTYVKTWNNALSDSFDNTLIEPSSQVFAAASQLSKGQSVVFSGTFLKPLSADSGECVNESSMTLSGKIREPEFIFRFSAIATQ